MHFSVLTFDLCSVGYAFINFEDVSRRSTQPKSSTLTVEKPYSIIDVSTLRSHIKDKKAYVQVVREG